MNQRFYSACWGRMLVVSALSAGALVVPALAHASVVHASTVADSASGGAASDITGVVTDSASGRPLQGVEVAIERGTAIVTQTPTDPFGHYRMHNLAAGPYTVVTHLIGYQMQSQPVTLADGRTAQLDFRLIVAPPQLADVAVTGQTPSGMDTRSGDQTYTQDEAHYTPTTTTSQVVQQAIAGAARAPTGEVHIRGQHAEYTYYVDGVPVTSGVSGSLNELFDPEVVQRIDFITGGWDAEFGEKSAAIINIQTRVPPGAFHADESTYYGSFNSMGQSVDLSTNQGKLAAFFSGSAQGTDMRREPVEGTADNVPINFSNHGDDYFGFGKLQYTASSRDILTLDGNYSTSYFQIPYDSSTGTVLHDHETDLNGFLNLAYRHRFGSDTTTTERGIPYELFIGTFFRDGGLQYRPGANDIPGFVDENDSTLTPRNVYEDRKFNTVGTKADFGFPVVSGLMDAKFGVLSSYTYGHEDFQLSDPTGQQPNIGSNSGLDGYDLSGYGETSVRPAEWFELRTGLRYDSHVAPFAPNETQWSPRVRLNFFPDPTNTIYLYFGRLFLPTNIEDLRSITLASGGGSVTASPTLPERDAFYEAAYIHRFHDGVMVKLDGYWKDSKPGIDDNTIPGSAITTDINQASSHVRGVESVIDVNPRRSPLTGYVNFALNHGYANGPVTGGFFALPQPNTTFDFDHDQRISTVANAVYTFGHAYISSTAIYGTGLTNGYSPDATVPYDTGSVAKGTYQPGSTFYCTGLLCFNTKFKVHPNYIQQWDLGYSFLTGRTYVRPEFFIDNAWDAHYVLKGAFYSGQSLGRPRSFTVKVKVGV